MNAQDHNHPHQLPDPAKVLVLDQQGASVSVQKLIDQKRHDDLAFALRTAAIDNNLGAVHVLISHGNPLQDDSAPLRYAASLGLLEMVKLLAPHSDITAKDCAALRWAAEDDHANVVEFLLPFCPKPFHRHRALVAATIEGHLDVVKVLLPHIDLTEDHHLVLREACVSGHLNVVDFLLTDLEQKGLINDLHGWLLKYYGSSFDPGAFALVKARLDQNMIKKSLSDNVARASNKARASAKSKL